MADKKEYVTSLVVEADDAQVAKLRDTLQQVSTLIQGIHARGAIGGGMGGPGGGGAGGAGGSGWGPGGSGQGGPSGWGGGQGGGPGGGSGGGQGGQPPQGQPGGPPRQIGVGAAQIVAQQDEGVLSSAASALPSMFPFIGAALGVAAGAAASAALSRGRLAIDFDRKQSATRGLLGWAPGAGTGAGMGFSPDETQAQAQAMAQSGLSADDLTGAARLPSVFGLAGRQRGPTSLFQAGLFAERGGYGASSVAGFLGMFRPGGGGALSFGVGADGAPTPGVTDPMRMENALSTAIGGALRAGLQSADIPKYLAKIQGAVTAMADKGVQVDPRALVAAAEQRTQMGGQAGIGASATAGMLGLGQQVSQGGGSPFTQFVMRLAAGAGQPGTDALDVAMNLQGGRYDMNDPYRVLRKIAGDTDRGRRAVAYMAAPQMGVGFEDMLNMLSGGEPEDQAKILKDLYTEGSEGQLRLGGRGVSSLMRQDAQIQASDVKAGQGMAPVNLALRRAMHGLTNSLAPKIAKGVQKLINLATSDTPQGAAGASGDALEYGMDVFGVDPASDLGQQLNKNIRAYRSIQNTGKPPAAKPIQGHPATQLPDPKGGNGYIEIRPAPGMERFFQFFYHQDMSAMELPA
jgi:hypothetical protein